MASICVYCGSSGGLDPQFRSVAADLGSTIAANGHRLIYGGGRVGLMGVIADSVIAGGGAVTGVMTEHLVAAEVAHVGLTSLEVTADMHSRKARMIELADGVVVLPGGFGTMEEAFEALTWNQLGLTRSPVVFLDVADFYAPLFAFIDAAVAAGLVKPDHGALAQRATEPADAVRMATAAAPAFTPKWIS